MSDQNVIWPSDAIGSISRGRRQPFEIHIWMRMMRAVPATTEERKNEIGRIGDHHCGSTMLGIRRKSDPSELWCIVDSVTAAMASMMGSGLSSRARKIHAIAPNTTAAIAV